MPTRRDPRAERAELLARALGDFETFCRALVVISPKDGQRCHLRWNRCQRRYHAARTRRDVILKARQQGFSTLELARDVWKFLQPGQRVQVICQTDKSQTYLKKFSADVERMFDGLEHVGIDLRFGVRAVGSWSLPERDSFLTIIESGATAAAAQKKGRGGTLTRLHSTEAAFYEYPELSLNATLEGVPNLPGTEVVFESTANGAGNWFHRFWLAAERRENGYADHFFPWFADPTYVLPLEEGEVVEPREERERELVERNGISPEQLKWYRQKVAEKTQDLTDQEYPSDRVRSFLVSGRTFFDKTATQRLVPRCTDHLRIDWREQAPTWRIDWKDWLRVWEPPQRHTQYVISADPSEGTGGDPGAAVVRERETSRHVATLHGQFPTWEFARLLAELGTVYAFADDSQHPMPALLVVERNNHGHSVLQALEREQRYRNIYVGDDEKPGWNTNAVSRATALDALEKAHRAGDWSTNDHRTAGEFQTFVIHKDGKPAAQSGAHDDLVLSEAILHDVLSKPVPRVDYDDTYDKYLPTTRV